VTGDGEQSSSSTVFCPGRARSVSLRECSECPRLSCRDEEFIECSPPTVARLARGLPVEARAVGTASVGDAMASGSTAVHADLATDALATLLEEETAAIAIVVDDLGCPVGLVEATDLLRALAAARASEVARYVVPLRESALLADAVDRMVRERARALPVTDDDGRVVALLTDLDTLRWVARLREQVR
jgi:CBS domain-containing protein